MRPVLHHVGALACALLKYLGYSEGEELEKPKSHSQETNTIV
jgi:hypothetical protein